MSRSSNWFYIIIGHFIFCTDLRGSFRCTYLTKTKQNFKKQTIRINNSYGTGKLTKCKLSPSTDFLTLFCASSFYFSCLLKCSVADPKSFWITFWEQIYLETIRKEHFANSDPEKTFTNLKNIMTKLKQVLFTIMATIFWQEVGFISDFAILP